MLYLSVLLSHIPLSQCLPSIQGCQLSRFQALSHTVTLWFFYIEGNVSHTKKAIYLGGGHFISRQNSPESWQLCRYPNCFYFSNYLLYKSRHFMTITKNLICLTAISFYFNSYNKYALVIFFFNCLFHFPFNAIHHHILHISFSIFFPQNSFG